MEWSEEGVVIAVRQHGEQAVIVTLLTESHGRHAGLVRGGASPRLRGLYQPGNLVSAVWRGRLSEHLGNFVCEMVRGYAGPLLEEPAGLAILASLCAVAETALPEREPHPDVYGRTLALVQTLATQGAGAAHRFAGLAGYVQWELALLRELGYGLDLRSCAVTGETANLAYVSPKSGRAVSDGAAGPWRERLLALPTFLLDGADERATVANEVEVGQGLALTGWFLDRYVFAQQGRRIPAARLRLVEACAQSTTIG